MPEVKKAYKAKRRLTGVDPFGVDLVGSPAIEKKFIVVKRQGDDRGFKVEKQIDAAEQAQENPPPTDSDAAQISAPDPRVVAAGELEILVQQGEPLTADNKVAMRETINRLSAAIAPDPNSVEGAPEGQGGAKESAPGDEQPAAQAAAALQPPATPSKEEPPQPQEANTAAEDAIDSAEASAFFERALNQEVGAALLTGPVKV